MKPLAEKTTVLTTTCLNVGSKLMKLMDVEYHVLVIDEAAQADELSTIVPIVDYGISHLVMAGDYKQLPPRVASEVASRNGLGVSLHQRVMQERNWIPRVQLDINYRTNEEICKLVSYLFYHNSLTTDKVRLKMDYDLLRLWTTKQMKHFAFYNVESFEENVGTSKKNQTEANELVKHLVLVLSKDLAKPTDIGVITPYEGQKQYLVKRLEEVVNSSVAAQIKIANVDSFQGSEKRLIYLSLVRANHNVGKNVGFLEDPGRLCTSLSRSKDALFIFGNAKTLCKVELYKLMIDHLQSNEHYFLSS